MISTSSRSRQRRLYLCWFVPYALWLISKGVFVTNCRSSFLDMKGKLTSMFKIPKSALRAQGLAYLLVHASLNGLALTFSSFMYESFILHTMWILGLLVSATWLGANYYEFTYGGKRAVKRLTQMAKKID